jgi:hypothetical protein
MARFDVKNRGKWDKEMAPDTRVSNHAISTERYRVERSFGSLKKHFGWGRSIYMGLLKTKFSLYQIIPVSGRSTHPSIDQGRFCSMVF